MSILNLAGKSGHIADRLNKAEHWARIYWANHLDRRGIAIDTFLDHGPGDILWAALEFDQIKRDPYAGLDFAHRPDHLPLLPRQLIVQRRMDALQPMDDEWGIVRQANGKLVWYQRPRWLAPECRK